jgi:hypothetical protein
MAEERASSALVWGSAAVIAVCTAAAVVAILLH